MKILIIEDNPGDARLVQELLKETPDTFTIDVAEELKAGLQFLDSHGVDVVLLDLGLPDSAGLGTLTRLQARFPQLPVVVMTSVDDEALAFRAVRQGAEYYLTKGQADGRLLHRILLYSIEHKLLNEALRQSELRYRTLVESAPDGIVSLDAEGRVIDCNQTLADLLGYSVAEVHGRHFSEFMADQTLDIEVLLCPARREGTYGVRAPSQEPSRSGGAAMGEGNDAI